ncbi:hypothetical protein SAMN03159489_02654 [Pseudomonas sp. NFPP07]|uniref:nuclear transport factor 2 family protein n=1 Tax=Pseudomonas sp. NFPP07 TaxID=1566213 RepID=UPI0008E47E36|nr:DUF4440 domain-containing protein [Pseudomonas sp. NFPP07]SFQ12879.1 hypothetical protein SAMN03159489_02654 [Pseudomonas sp. NFPP07]
MQLPAQLLALESELHDPAVRADRRRLVQLLAEEFVEFGASGRVWNRAQIIEALLEEAPAQHSVSDFRVQLLATGVALVTYRCRTLIDRQAPQDSLRSSCWRQDGDAWRMVFHQGTRAAPRVDGRGHSQRRGLC